ncbi:MAG: hypothetical protein F6K18_32015 [Okeania sp. SIO2C2]|uniref:hypothetical protein n=1 Tax=Okeania sp. SIO2C2 TaxID=2607787 RepID=UPI0013B62B6A|nr:hypothetical protein [Okeania sp. SIO2C2]NEP91069.1 hypothetical protein [Okeania sp. SIO2C2]
MSLIMRCDPALAQDAPGSAPRETFYIGFMKQIFTLLTNYLQVTWKYETIKSVSTSTITQDDTLEIIAPPLEDLQILFELA